MRMDDLPRFQRRRGLSLGVLIALVATACTGATPTVAPTQAPVTTAAPTAAVTAAPTAEKTLEIAYISFAVANSYDAPMLAAAQGAAGALNAKLTVFDGNLTPDTQTRQLQDAVAAGKYDGIITQPVYGGGLVEGVKAALAAGVAVANIDQILGTDFTTANNQVDGLAANVVFIPSVMGKKFADLAIKSCTARNLNPCDVGYIWSVKAAGLDIALRAAYDAEIASHPEIKIVWDSGESFYTTPGGLKAAQDMLTAQPNVDVIIAADQAITGALQAVTDANVKGKVDLIGYGAGAVAIQGIAAGDRYATVAQLPATEGRLGVEQLVKFLRTGVKTPGMDPLASMPDDGIITKDNAGKFTAEWPG
jgi:ribose transport system substrate-binding protein